MIASKKGDKVDPVCRQISSITVPCCFFGPVDLFAIFLDRKDPTDIAELFVNALVTERCCCHWSGVDSELFAVDMLWCFPFFGTVGERD